MKEHNRPSEDWYQQKILEMGDHDYLIGQTPFPLNECASESTMAFSALVRLERRNKGLTVAKLAEILDVEVDEIRSIEHNVTYHARPRTILNFARYFKLPKKEVMRLAGAAVSNDEGFCEKAMRFAARSDDIGALSREEQQLLSQFIEFLRDNPS